MSFSNRLIDAIEKAGIEQKILSEESGISEGTISRIVSGKRENPRNSTVRKLKKALKTHGAKL